MRWSHTGVKRPKLASRMPAPMRWWKRRPSLRARTYLARPMRQSALKCCTAAGSPLPGPGGHADGQPDLDQGCDTGGPLDGLVRGDRAAEVGADKVGGRGVERVHDRDGVGDVLIPAVQRRIGASRCSISSNIGQRNAIPASKSVGKRPHAVVIGPTAVQHDDQLAAADDLAHERPAVIPDVQCLHHHLSLPSSGIPRPRRRGISKSPTTPPLQHTLWGYTLAYTYPVGVLPELMMGVRS